jgi:hypothetical protein
MDKIVAGRGRKRPLIDVPIERLELDPENPRFPKNLRDKQPTEVIEILKSLFDLDELAQSMAENGYFDEEPLVAVPINIPKVFLNQDSLKLINNQDYLNFISNEAHFTVVEGNRRLATVKILLSDKLRGDLKIKNWPQISDEVKKDLSVLPVIIYRDRDEVLRYMGVRHIAGIKKWEAFSRALYISELLDAGLKISEIQQQVGDRSSSVIKLYLGYKLVDIADSELGLPIEKPKEYFSYLLLAIGQKAVKDFLGLPRKLDDIDLKSPVPEEREDNLKHLFSWLFGEGKEKLPVIRESRDITNLLSPVLRNDEATKYLIANRNLQDAFDRSDGEKVLLIKNLKKASKSLSGSLGLITKYKTEDEVKKEVEYCQDILNDLTTLLK